MKLFLILRQLAKEKSESALSGEIPNHVRKSQRLFRMSKCQAEPKAQSHGQASFRREIAEPDGELSTNRKSMSARTKESPRIGQVFCKNRTGYEEGTVCFRAASCRRERQRWEINRCCWKGCCCELGRRGKWWNPNLSTEGGRDNKLMFMARSGGGLEIVYDSEGIGKRERDGYCEQSIGEKAKAERPGFLKTLPGAGLQANLFGGWTTAETHKWADISPSEGRSEPGDVGRPSHKPARNRTSTKKQRAKRAANVRITYPSAPRNSTNISQIDTWGIQKDVDINRFCGT